MVKRKLTHITIEPKGAGTQVEITYQYLYQEGTNPILRPLTYIRTFMSLTDEGSQEYKAALDLVNTTLHPWEETTSAYFDIQREGLPGEVYAVYDVRPLPLNHRFS